MNSSVQITRLFLRSFASDARAQVLSAHRFILTVRSVQFSELIRPVPHSNPVRTVSISKCPEIRSITSRGPATHIKSHTSLQKHLLALFSGSQQFCQLQQVLEGTGYGNINLLKPTAHVMHQQFNIQQLYVLPTLYLCVLYLSENNQGLVPLTA